MMYTISCYVHTNVYLHTIKYGHTKRKINRHKDTHVQIDMKADIDQERHITGQIDTYISPSVPSYIFTTSLGYDYTILLTLDGIFVGQKMNGPSLYCFNPHISL